MNEFNSDISEDLICTDSNNNSNDHHVKLLYQELADKEQALILAAQFGKNLIDEKEDLEKQIELIKREQQNQIENLEQESYELKRLIESMRNEYETKIYELNEDLHLLNRKLLQKEQIKQSQQQQNEQFEIIQELNEKNQKLIQDFKSIEIKNTIEQQKSIELEIKLAEKEKILNENSIRLNNFQNQINQLVSKQQELDYAFIQTCNERDKQTKIIEELTNKYLFLKNEKNDFEHLLYQHENEIFSLKRENQELVLQLESFNRNKMNRKRRSNNSSLKKNVYNTTYDFYSSSFTNGINSTSNKKLNYSTSTTSTTTNSQFDNTAASYLFDNQTSLEQEQRVEYQDIDEDCQDIDVYKMNEIEQDDEDVDSHLFFSHFSNGATNWQQETIELTLNNKSEPEEEEDQDNNNNNDANIANKQNNNKTTTDFNEEESSSSIISKI